MKAKIINSKIVRGLPKYYKHWAGNFDEQTTVIHESEGFYEIEIPVIDSDLQKKGEFFFDEKNKVFTQPVVDLVIDLETERTKKLKEFEQIIETEMMDALKIGVLEKLALGEPVAQETKDKLLALRSREAAVIRLMNSVSDPKALRKFGFDRTEIEENHLLKLEI